MPSTRHCYFGIDRCKGILQASCQGKTPAVKQQHTKKFASSVEHFNVLEEIAQDAMKWRDTSDTEIFLANLKETALPDWAECINVLDPR